jgi:hypothetical protein
MNTDFKMLAHFNTGYASRYVFYGVEIDQQIQ